MKKRLPSSSPQILPQQEPTLGYTIDPSLATMEEWFTTEDVMKHLNMSRSSVYRRRRSGDIPAFKLGNIFLYPKRLINGILMEKSMLNYNPKLYTKPPPEET
ncbi:helix-turn-helix protein [Flavobacteriaceae bacterium MAR_2010_105]|nr:helix-turn-helix protein [Flavobacteriaceae bacterium MAR_2010_105]